MQHLDKLCQQLCFFLSVLVLCSAFRISSGDLRAYDPLLKYAYSETNHESPQSKITGEGWYNIDNIFVEFDYVFLFLSANTILKCLLR